MYILYVYVYVYGLNTALEIHRVWELHVNSRSLRRQATPDVRPISSINYSYIVAHTSSIPHNDESEDSGQCIYVSEAQRLIRQLDVQHVGNLSSCPAARKYFTPHAVTRLSW